MGPHRSKDKPTSSRPRPWWEVVDEWEIPKSGGDQTPANDQNNDLRSRSLIPVQNITAASQGPVQPRSSRPSQDQIDAHKGNALARGKGIYRPEFSAERLIQTTVAQPMLPPPFAPKAPAKPRKPMPPGYYKDLNKATEDEDEICTENETTIVKMFEKNHDWPEIGFEIGVPPSAVRWMWYNVFEKDHPESREKRYKARKAASQRKYRAKEKESESKSDNLVFPLRGFERKIESKAKKPR